MSKPCGRVLAEVPDPQPELVVLLPPSPDRTRLANRRERSKTINPVAKMKTNAQYQKELAAIVAPGAFRGSPHRRPVGFRMAGNIPNRRAYC